MDIANLKACIKYGVNEKQTRKQIIKNTSIISLFIICSSIFGFFINDFTFVFSIINCILAIVMIICSVLFSNKLSIKNRVVDNACKSLLLTIMFGVLSAIFFEMAHIPYYVCFFLVPVLIAIFSVLKMVNRVNRKTFINNVKNVDHSKIIIATTSGALVGSIFMKKNIENIDQESLYLIISLCFCFLSSAFSVGISNFLKLYYIKFLESKNVNMEDL